MDLLRFALKLDAVVSGAAGVAMVAGARVLDRPLGVPAVALVATGLVLVAWAVVLWIRVSRGDVGRRVGWTVIGVNAVWAVASVLLAVGWSALTVAGTVVVLLQAAAVLGVADLQYLGVRRTSG
jgi:hypothetical protein